MNGLCVAVLAVTIVVCATGNLFSLQAQEVEFRSVLTNAPLNIKPQLHEIETDAVREFKGTGRNPYVGQETPLSAGKTLYKTYLKSATLRPVPARSAPALLAMSTPTLVWRRMLAYSK